MDKRDTHKHTDTHTDTHPSSRSAWTLVTIGVALSWPAFYNLLVQATHDLRRVQYLHHPPFPALAFHKLFASKHLLSKGSTSSQEAPHRKSWTQSWMRMLTTPITSLESCCIFL